MADEKILKPKSFRIDEETAAKFKEISESIGGNQQEALAKLIETYEFQSGKAVLTEKKADIEQFEKYANILIRMFMASLEDNQNLSQTIRTEYDALLKSKDATIQELQKQLENARLSVKEMGQQAKEAVNENEILKKTIDGLNKEYQKSHDAMEQMLSDKDKLNHALTESYTSLQERYDKISAAAEQFSSIKESLDQTERELKETREQRDRFEKDYQEERLLHKIEMDDLKEKHNDAMHRQKENSGIALEKALLTKEKEFQEQLGMLNAEKQKEIDLYQKKYADLLEQTKKEHDSKK